MRFAVRQLVLGLMISLCCAGIANAQYLKITTDNPTDNTRMRASGTTILTITLDTNHDKNASTQTCNSHTLANSCGSTATGQALDMFSYTLALKAVGGTVTWGTFSTLNASYTDVSPQIQSDTEIEINRARSTGTDIGLQQLGTLPVTPVTGAPGVQVEIGPSILNPFGFGTAFGTSCDAFTFANSYVVGDPADPCGATLGIAGDWFDWDGALSASGNTPPTITAPGTASGSEGTAITPITATATDPEGAQTLTITTGALPAWLHFSSTPSTSPATGQVTGTPGFSDAGTVAINWHVDDGAGGTNNTSTQLTIANTDRAPTLAQPNNMTVNEGSTAEQVITGTDPDNDPLTFAIVSGPPFMNLVSPTPTSATVRLLPSFTQSGTYSATVRATDGTLFDDKSFNITVNNVDRAPVLTQPNNMTVDAGATANQSITATDPDGDALSFSKASGPTYMTVTTTTPGSGTGTGNIHLAPGAGDVGTASADVSASDGTLSNTKTIQITVNAGANTPPVLAQPNNMTVNEGATADQSISATDADLNPISFSKVSGPTYATVTTTTPGTGTGTGNIHLAPGFSDSGTASLVVRADDGQGGTNDKTLQVTVNNVNRAPTLNQPNNMTVAEGATADQAITGTDPDGDALTFSKISGPTYVTITTTNATTGNVHLAPGFTDAGSATVSASASDGSLSNGKSFTVTVTNTNRAPTLTQPANMTVNEGATADQALNGTDPDGDALTFAKVSGPTYLTVTTTNPTTGNAHLAPGFTDAGTAAATVSASDGSLSDSKSFSITVNNVDRAPTLDAVANMTVTQGATADQAITASDPDGDALTFSQVAGPTFMTVTTTNATTGNIHLAPGAAEPTGTFAASVRATDGTLNSNVQPFTITVNPAVVNNNPPVLAAISNMTVNENATADQGISSTDPDNNPVTFSKLAGPTFMAVTTISPGTGSATGNIHLTPGFSDAGTYGATVRADDGAGGTNDKSFTITVNNTNRAPILGTINPMTVTENATADQAISATDPDGDALTFSKVTGPTFVTITTTTPTTGNVHAAPIIGDAGTYTVQAQVTDGSLSDTHIFSVTVSPFVANNNPPVLARPSDMTVDEGATADQAISATDQDGNPVTFQILSGPGFATITNAVPGTGTATANIHLAPGFSDAGTYGVTLRANDGNGGTDDKSFTITVNNVDRAPTLAVISDMTVTEGSSADQTISASDPDGDSITFTKTTGPAFMTIVPASATTATIHLAPGGGTAGSYSASVTASDGSMSDTKSFTITVNPATANHAPTLDQPTDMTVNEGETADQQLTASDPDNDPLTFSKVGGPTFMTVSPTGLVHLAPGFADAGTSTGTVRVSDGSLTDEKSFTITVNNVNRAPVADAGGPYTGIIGVAVNFNGGGSSDPDGDALTYAWDFDSTDGIQTDATGVTASHTYTVGGTYTVTLTVSDGSLSASDTATATISTSGGFQAEASVNGGDRVIRLQSNKPFWCVDIQSSGNFTLSDIIPSSVRLTYNGTSISSVERHIVSQDNGFSVEICFAKSDLRTLFSSLSNGKTDVTVTITGDLSTGGSFVASLDVTVQKTGGPNAAAANHGHGLDVFAWASPNPLNPSTTISFVTTQSGRVTLNVYDVSGRLVKALANQTMDAGVHDVRWDGSTRAGTRAASGVYYYVLRTPERTVKSQLVIAK